MQAEDVRSRKGVGCINLLFVPMSGSWLTSRKEQRPSEPSALSAKLNSHNGLPDQDLRTVGPDADANAGATCVGQISTVHSKPLEPLTLDDADGVDANCPASSEQEGEIAPSGWETTL